ncbi:MAG TPA: hypothetical protein VF899_08840 [Pyrinomonadaceae bacterium]
MTARDTKRPNSHQSAMKWSAFVLSACLLMSGLAALQPWRIARAAAPSVVQFSASTYNVSEDMTFKRSRFYAPLTSLVQRLSITRLVMSPRPSALTTPQPWALCALPQTSRANRSTSLLAKTSSAKAPRLLLSHSPMAWARPAR